MNTTDCYKDNPIRSYVEDELLEEINEWAAENDMKRSSAIRRLVRLGLRHDRMLRRRAVELDDSPGREVQELRTA